MSKPGQKHGRTVKWILRYMKGSLDMALCYEGTNVPLRDYVDSEFAGDVDSRRSTTSFIFMLGSGAESWVSRLQKIVPCLRRRLNMLQ